MISTAMRTWSREQFVVAVQDAVWAPSMHNSQPWRFRRTGDGIDVLLDPARVVPVSDPAGRAARISCGAAAYNLRLALAVGGTPAQYRLGLGEELVHLWPAPARPPTPAERLLHQQIHRRHTNRGPFADSPVEPDVPARLAEAARREDGWLDFVAGESSLGVLAGLIRTADARLNADPAYRAEVRAWTAGNHLAVEGIEPAAAGAAPHPAELLTRRDFGGASQDATRDVARDPVVAVFGLLGDAPADAVRAGMALQSVLLTATELGLATAMYSQPIEVPQIRDRLRVALGRLYDPHLVLRFGYAPTTCYTNRRAVADVVAG